MFRTYINFNSGLDNVFCEYASSSLEDCVSTNLFCAALACVLVCLCVISMQACEMFVLRLKWAKIMYYKHYRYYQTYWGKYHCFVLIDNHLRLNTVACLQEIGSGLIPSPGLNPQCHKRHIQIPLTGYIGLIWRSTAEATVRVPLRVLWGYAAATACTLLLS